MAYKRTNTLTNKHTRTTANKRMEQELGKADEELARDYPPLNRANVSKTLYKI